MDISIQLSTIQFEIYDFLGKANPILAENGSVTFQYGGNFITGNPKNPEYLFLGINPGFGEEWKIGATSIVEKKFEIVECKFKTEFHDGCKLATQIVKTIFGGDEAKLDNCAETSFISFFATKNVSQLNAQLRELEGHNILNRYSELMEKYRKIIVENIKPKQIVCIGLTTFHSFMKTLGIKHSQVHSRSINTNNPNYSPVYYKTFEVDGCRVHGVLHLSGARLSNEMLEELKLIFSNLN